MTASITYQPLSGISFPSSGGELQDVEHLIHFIWYFDNSYPLTEKNYSQKEKNKKQKTETLSGR